MPKQPPPPTLVFLASLPPIQSAITLDGRGDGSRIKIDVPRTDTEQIRLLQEHYTERLFRVTIEPVEE